MKYFIFSISFFILSCSSNTHVLSKNKEVIDNSFGLITRGNKSPIVGDTGGNVNINYNQKDPEDIYSLEEKGIRNDERISGKILDHYSDLDARSIYHIVNDGNSYKKTKFDIAKEKCMKALGMDQYVDYYKLFGHDFLSISYKDKNSKSIVQYCGEASSVSDDSSEFLYYVSIGYHIGSEYKKAIQYLRKASGSGSLDARRKLGIMYMTGSLVDKNEIIGKEWLIKAANDGDKAAQEIVGKF